MSPERLSTYLREANGCTDCAVELYVWNAKVSSKFWQVVGFTEVALRNMIDAQLNKSPDDEYSWFKDSKIVKPGGRVSQKITRAVETLGRNGKQITHGRIVTELNLGFWQHLVSKTNRNLWPTIKRGLNSSRKITPDEFAKLIEEFHQFRNRLAHHYKIWHLDLFRQYWMIFEILELIDPQLSQYVASEFSILEYLRIQPKCLTRARQ